MLASECLPLDALLQGGLEPDALALVFGEAGSGKTNYALQCARSAVAAGKRVAYVDTEGVSPVRLRQVFGDTDTSRLLFFTPYTIGEQEKMVQRSTLLQDLGLIVVDSINMHYRLHIDGDDSEKVASRSLYKQLHHLTSFARRHRVPVLITGQVYGTEDSTQPFARRIMEHLVKILVRFEKRQTGDRRATLLKHRSIPEGKQALFRIGAQGLEPRAKPKRPVAPATQSTAAAAGSEHERTPDQPQEPTAEPPSPPVAKQEDGDALSGAPPTASQVPASPARNPGEREQSPDLASPAPANRAPPAANHSPSAANPALPAARPSFPPPLAPPVNPPSTSEATPLLPVAGLDEPPIDGVETETDRPVNETDLGFQTAEKLLESHEDE